MISMNAAHVEMLFRLDTNNQRIAAQIDRSTQTRRTGLDFE